MSPRDEPAPSDPALAPYLSAATDTEASERLGELLESIAAPLVWRVIRRQLGGDVAHEELEDLHANTLLRLQLQLAGLRAGDREPMASLPDYVAVTAFNAVSAFLMAREPERTRLRYRVRYVLRKDSRLATWTAAGHDTHCGLTAWHGAPPAADARRLARLALDAAADLGRAPARFAALLYAVVERLGAPCRVEDLVDALATALDVRDDPLEPISAGGPDDAELGRAEPEDPERSAEAALEARQALARMWREVVELPRNQRIALLLNLRDEGGGDMLGALLGTGVVDVRTLAAALELPEAELAGLMPDLPLEDSRIAERLGLGRQQVINLRKSARLRLGRRLRGQLPGMGV